MSAPDRLFELLPAVYRDQDADNGDVLRALLGIVTEQVDVVERDIAQLYDDLFIETSREWVIPYVGDLVANDLLYDPSRIDDSATASAVLPDLSDLTGPSLRPHIAVRTRADVANTIYYRRRKGTLPMLEELARDVTGWAAHAVEFMELVGWAQQLEHHRPQAAMLDVRSLERDDRVGGAFDDATHTVDVRSVGQRDGWHHHRHVGFFLWRLGAFPLRRVPARPASAPWRFHFNPLGNAAPLFSRMRREGDEAGLATELHVPGPIRRAFFQQDLTNHKTTPPPAATDLYGTPANPEASIDVTRNGTHVPAAQIACARLHPWPAARPVGNVVAIDVAVGRLVLGDGFVGSSRVDVDLVYGFPAEIGGGPYERRAWLVKNPPTLERYQVLEGVTAPPSTLPSVAAALGQWVADGRPGAVIQILDSRTYRLPATITLADQSRLTIEADSGERPLLVTDPSGLGVGADGVDPDPEQRGWLTLSGVAVEGFVHVSGDLGGLRLLHSTLIPGRSIEDGVAPGGPSLVVEGAGPINTHLQVEIVATVTGAIVVPGDARSVTVLDSIVDGGSSSAAAITAGAGSTATTRLTLERATVVGRTNVRELEASEAIFTGRVDTVQTQAGCVRFSSVPLGSRTPRRHRCQPDLAIAARIDQELARNPVLTAAARNAIGTSIAARMQASFTAGRFGQPAYLQLREGAPWELRTGAADGSEMGAYCQLKQPQRESNLLTRLDEYLPFGLEAGPIYVT
ncbi:MAG: hypothetical protein M3Z27_00090 [Actinomycetota bacterium]|nr:hypothetical protein [Actinomycetota bacterium]